MGDLSPDLLSAPLQAAADALTARFGERVTFSEPFRGQLTASVAAEDLLEVLGWLKTDGGFGHLVDVTAADYLPASPRFAVVYHLFSLDPPRRLRLETWVDEGQSVPSATALWSGANFSEREVFDLFGIPFGGHPNLTRILLPDDYVGYPLRRDHALGDIPVEFDLPARKRFSHATD
jgi:NADH-quinone oxidoreductase subunit C